jgi:3-methyladenine DNA glycosylase AlkD
MILNNLKKDLKKFANPKRAKVNQWFFKTGKGEYGEGDVFIGLTMPDVRKIAKKYIHLSIKEVEQLLHSKIHEHRMVALVIWTYQFEKADNKTREKIYKAYLKNTKWINNWDLVDVTTPGIVGMFLLDKDRKILYDLAKSKNLWEKRIAILATFAFINKNKESKDTLKIAEILLDDEHDLIHKGVGWMLREVGKRVSQQKEEEFLRKHYKKMPRTMLRYAIERFDEKKRQFYLKK